MSAVGEVETVDVSRHGRLFRRLWWCARIHYFAAALLMLPLPLLMIGYIFGGGMIGAMMENEARDHVLEVATYYFRYLTLTMTATALVAGYYAHPFVAFAGLALGVCCLVGLAFLYFIVDMHALFGPQEDYSYWIVAIAAQLVLAVVAVIALACAWQIVSQPLPRAAGRHSALDTSAMQYPTLGDMLRSLLLPALATLLAFNLADIVLMDSYSPDLAGWLRWGIDTLVLNPGVTLLSGLVAVVPVLDSYFGLLEFVAPLIMFLAEIGILIVVWRLGERLVRVGAEQRILRDGRAPVLLLRSFTDDDAAIRPKSLVQLALGRRTRLEEVVASQVARLGPFVAVGMPGERLPRLGAHRAYLSDDDWQPFVLAQIRNAKVIVMVVGTTRWVGWELEQVMQQDAMTKLVLIFPPSLEPAFRERWSVVEAALASSPWRDPLSGLASPSIRALRLLPEGRILAVTSELTIQSDFELALQTAM